MKSEIRSKNLLYTNLGQKWLAQFVGADQDIAERIIDSLTLVSHSEFLREIQKALEQEATGPKQPAAIFAVREIDPSTSYFAQVIRKPNGEVLPLLDVSDVGSEGEMAFAVRQFCKPKPKLRLNHPTIAKMRKAKVRKIILVDDVIGSGKRVTDFLDALWKVASLTSWHSLKYIKFVVVSYSGTRSGCRQVRRHKCKPEIRVTRPCPTFSRMPIKEELRDAIRFVCQKYGNQTSKPHMSLGFRESMASMVFEHGCPNNTPSILWAPSTPKNPWVALFPNRTIGSAEKSVFPVEIARRDPLVTLLEVGQEKLAKSDTFDRRSETGTQIILTLALIAKGQRRIEALSYAIGLDGKKCVDVRNKCVEWGFLTKSYRLTKRGSAELEAARKDKFSTFEIPEVGEIYYYPKKLREAKPD